MYKHFTDNIEGRTVKDQEK